MLRTFFTPESIRVSVGKLRPVWVQALEFLDNSRTEFPDRHQLGVFAHRMPVFHSGNPARLDWEHTPYIAIVI